ncbi:hypothetical protein HGRIS_013313 [Hohenbuehelia grisea]|uniref:RecA family profile 1 domain-containing protein n=1 Tax=Hohenbuehelia grisea TaxID=104357 RepID=A0ABR3IVB1_9AGAR
MTLAASGFQDLSPIQKAILKKGNVEGLESLLLHAPNDVARKCKASVAEIQAILATLCIASSHPLKTLEELETQHDDRATFTTGDITLDAALGGGIETSMVWEVVGESAAGKTQLALQLSLAVQLPLEAHGLSGAACYITTSAALPTNRLSQILEAHPDLSSSSCSLTNIHTLSTPTIPVLIQVLKAVLPAFVAQRAAADRPIKLIVIDALAELYHSSTKTTTTTLVDRSRSIAEISGLLHSIASKYRIAVVVLNEVVDSFNRGSSGPIDPKQDLLYAEQSRWFSRANSIPREDLKEASLGLVWANQINARIILTRTGRRRHLDDDEAISRKGSKLESYSLPSASDNMALEQQPTLVRRLSIVFNTVAAPISLDYIITAAGFQILPGEGYTPTRFTSLQSVSNSDLYHSADSQTSTDPSTIVPRNPLGSQISPLDVGFAEDANNLRQAEEEASRDVDEDEEEEYWRDDPIPDHLLHDIDLHIVDRKSTEEIIPSSQIEDEVLT